MNTLAVALALCAVGILVSGLFSGVETGAYSFQRSRHRLRLAEGHRRALLVDRLTGDMTTFVVVCLIGTNLANALVSFSATMALEQWAVFSPELVSTLTVGPVLFILGELLPKELFRTHADHLVYSTAPLIRLSAVIFAPALLLVGVLTWILRRLGLAIAEEFEGVRARERLRTAITAGAEGGTVTSFQATMARNIFALEERTVAEAMIPLGAVDQVEASTDLEQARTFAASRKRARYPVYRNHPDQVIGLLSTYDLLFEERPGLTIRNYVGEIATAPPDEPVAELLVRMRRKRAKMALVEEGGRAVGIVTLKDLVEEITGELTDL